MSGDAIRLRFPARPEYLLLARLAVTAVARRMALGRVEVGDLKLAVTEACSNAVRHAYAKGPPGEIGLELLVDGDRLELVVEDRGAGIELPLREAVPPSESGGMGLRLIQAVVDDFAIGPGEDGTGTVVRMTKHAEPAGAAARNRELEV
jgi:serine/threonine-protein kinase RsbW